MSQTLCCSAHCWQITCDFKIELPPLNELSVPLTAAAFSSDSANAIHINAADCCSGCFFVFFSLVDSFRMSSGGVFFGLWCFSLASGPAKKKVAAGRWRGGHILEASCSHSASFVVPSTRRRRRRGKCRRQRGWVTFRIFWPISCLIRHFCCCVPAFNCFVRFFFLVPSAWNVWPSVLHLALCCCTRADG